MCVAAIAWNAHPRWRLVAAGNRDELHARLAAPLGRWPDRPPLVAGRDLQSGGTWFGVSEAGRLAVVTNLRGFGLPAEDRPSRGELVTDLLAGRGTFAKPSEDQLADFNPFNLITFWRDRLEFWTNRPKVQRRQLESGVYALSNGPLDAPWPKTTRLHQLMTDWLAEPSPDPRALFAGLAEDRLPAAPARAALPASDALDEPPVTPIFVRNAVWGTRCSTVVAVDSHGHGVMIERRFSPSGDATGETTLPFTWPDWA